MQSTRAFEITVLSAEDLRLGDRPLKKKKQNTLVSLRTDHANNRETTSLDVEGGSYPTWNETLRLSTPAFTTWFMVEVQCIDHWSEKKTVAMARVPVSDFREPANYLHFLSYRLKGRDGKRNGIINLSIRVC